MESQPTSQFRSYSFGAWTLNDILTDTRTELKNALFRIPDYQRGYAWQERQWTEFWDDVLVLLDGSAKKHYTGAITVERNPKGFFDVVDGQQRLTTISILLSTLGEPRENPLFTSDPTQPVRFSYADENENLSLFEKLLALSAFQPVAGSDGRSLYSPPKSLVPENSHQRNLLDAKSFFSRKISEAFSGDEGKKKSLASALTNSLVFDFRILGQDDNAGLVFETMNNRGKPLTLLEKLKNRLMYLVELADPDDFEIENNDEVSSEEPSLVDRASIQKTWETIYRELAKHPTRDPLDEDEFAAAHLSLYRKPKESVYSEGVAESRLFKMFCRTPEHFPISEEIDETDDHAIARARRDHRMERPWREMRTSIREYVDDLKKFASAWSAIHERIDSSCGRCQLLSATREVKIFLASVRLHVSDENLRRQIFEKSEQILLRNTIRSVMDETTFATLARRLHRKCLGLLKGENQKPIDGESVFKELTDALGEDKRKIDAKTLVDYFSDRMGRKQAPFGYYGWPGLKYFLFTQEGEGGLAWSLFSKTSLEHIIPQSSTQEDRPNGWWTRQIQDYVPEDVQFDPDKRKNNKVRRQRKRMLVNSLGNFVLLTQGENSSVSDDPWEQYAEVEGKHGTVIGKRAFYLDPNRTSSAGAREVAQTATSWNAYQILKRGRKLFKRLADLLGVGDLADLQIIQALGFDETALPVDTRFGPLPEDKVSELAPKFGSAKKIKEDGSQSMLPEAINEVFGVDCTFISPDGTSFRTKTMDRLFPTTASSDLWGVYRFGLTKANNGIQLVFHPGVRLGETDKAKCRKAILERLPDNVRNNLLLFPECKSRLVDEKGNKFGEWITATQWIISKKSKGSLPENHDELKTILIEVRNWEHGLETGDDGRRLISFGSTDSKEQSLPRPYHQVCRGRKRNDSLSAAPKTMVQFVKAALRELCNEINSFRNGPDRENVSTSFMDAFLPPRQTGEGGWQGRQEIYRYWVRPTKDVDGLRLTLELGPGRGSRNKEDLLAGLPTLSREHLSQMAGFDAWEPTGKTHVFRTDLAVVRCSHESDSVKSAVRQLLNKILEWEREIGARP